MKILITGINGFLGQNLVNDLNNKHHLFGLGTSKTFIKGVPVYNSKNLEELDLDIDIIIVCHAAVASGSNILSNDILFEVNVLLTEKIVVKFKNAFIIYISTVSVYDLDFSCHIFEKSHINPQSNYALSKLWGEKVISDINRSVILRVSSIYGVGMKENTLIPNYVNQALQKDVIEVWGKGERLQNYVHVNDVVKYINLIIEQKENFENKIFLGISKNQYSNLEIAEIISNVTRAKISFVNEDNSKSLYYNNDFTTDLLNWKPETSIEIALQNYIEWKKKEY